MSGQIVDAPLVAAHRQREKEGWSAREIWPDQPVKAAPEGAPQPPDIAIPVFGYKAHIAIDRRHGVIRRRLVSDAATHHGARLCEGLIDPDNMALGVWADTAYRSQANEDFLLAVGKVSHIHVKKPKGKPMSDRTARANARKSAIRAKVEHPFAMLKGPMKLFIRTIGLKRAEAAITFTTMAYNMKCWVWLNGRTASA